MTVFERLSAFWQDSLTLLLGVALFFSPWFLGFETVTAAALNAYVVGAVLMIMGLLALFAFQRWEDWVSGLLGAWLIISPWFLGFGTVQTPSLTHLVIGIAAVVLAIWSINEHESGHLHAER